MTSHYEQLSRSISGLSLPALVLDKVAWNKNVEWALRSAGNKAIRIASKSVRCLPLLQELLSQHKNFCGLMSFTLQEALWLRSQGITDILLGYPTTDLIGLGQLARDPAGIVLMVDRPEHLDLIEQAAKQTGKIIEVCVDVDLSLDLPAVRFGVYRSVIQESKQLITLLEHLKKTSHIKLVGLMGYEAQIAGVADKGHPLLTTLKKLSIPRLRKRRQAMLDIIHNYGHKLRLVNGGGTGSLNTTTQEACVTEVTIGSAFYGPRLFDNYSHFTLSPALYFALPIVRQAKECTYTCLGGGYIASGSVGPDRWPLIALPPGGKYQPNEGAGEVQTPVQYPSHVQLKIGDPIFFRHAKAGEICERFATIQVVEDSRIVATHATYRGQGQSFL